MMRIWRIERYGDMGETYDKTWEVFHMTREGVIAEASRVVGQPLEFTPLEHHKTETYGEYVDGDNFYLEPIEVLE
jgi:hypothetical protein